jgi:hypothetical protein
MNVISPGSLRAAALVRSSDDILPETLLAWRCRHPQPRGPPHLPVPYPSDVCGILGVHPYLAELQAFLGAVLRPTE